MSSKHTEETDVPEHLSLSLGGLSCLSAAELCSYLLSCPACLITYCKRPVCVSEIRCLCAHFVYVTTWHFCVFSGSRGDHVSSLLSSSTVLLSVSFCPSCSLFSAYLSISLSFCFALSHFLSTPHIPSVFISFFLSFSLCLCLLLSCLSYFSLPGSFSHSQAAINRSLVGCWSVRNGRSDGFSQLLQAFPGLPHCTALCGPGFQTWRQNIQDMNRVLNIWTALMWAWLILPSSPES